MPDYVEQVETEKLYTGNVVIRLGGKYYAIRKPDSGLSIPYPRSSSVATLVLNPAQINPKSVTTTIASYNFKLIDKEGYVSRVVKDRGADLVSSDVEIWLGRSGVGMDFADYYKLPITKLSKIQKTDAGYTFATRETTERMNRPIYARKIRLDGEILAATTTIISKDDISKFPAAGAFRLGDELVEYGAKDDATKTFLFCGRGAFGTTPADQEDNTDIYQAEFLEDVNPIDILLRILTSGGGGGSYDLLSDGLAISASLIDFAAIETIRDELFLGDTFSFALYNIDNALKFIETQILLPCNLRFTYAKETGKLSLAVLDRAVFVEDEDVIDHSTITAHPTLEISDSEVVNSLEISFDYDEDTGKYRQLAVYEDQESIDNYGAMSSPFKAQFKGVSSPDFVERFADSILGRLSIPSPQITVKTQMNKSLLTVGDKSFLETNLLASEYGELNFANGLEVLSRAINWQNGDVTLKLAFTSTTGYRLCYIAPSDKIPAWISDSIVTLNADRGQFWRAGWKCRLFDKVAGDYVSAQVNIIDAIADDEIYFADPWAGVDQTADKYVLKFPDYDEATPTQRRYCYIGINNAPFSKYEKSYSIVP